MLAQPLVTEEAVEEIEGNAILSPGPRYVLVLAQNTIIGKKRNLALSQVSFACIRPLWDAASTHSTASTHRAHDTQALAYSAVHRPFVALVSGYPGKPNEKPAGTPCTASG